MLLINRNRPVATDALIEAAWEQFPPPDPRASLHSYVSNLRKLLGERRSLTPARHWSARRPDTG